MSNCELKDGRLFATCRQPRFDLTDPLVKQKLTWLHIIDWLAGMKDRQPYNYFVKIDRNTKRFVGVRGIDNESCFDSDATLPEEGSMLQLAAMEVIDTEMRDRIFRLSGDVYDRLYGRILGAAQIAGAKGRLRALQKKITDGDVRVIGTDEWAAVELRNPQTSYTARDGNPHRLPLRA